MPYTELDAFVDILVWQLPVPCALATGFLVALLTNHVISPTVPLWWCPILSSCGSDKCGCTYLSVQNDERPVLFYLCAFSTFFVIWVAVALPILVIDALLIPPVFAFIRYTEAMRAGVNNVLRAT